MAELLSAIAVTGIIVAALMYRLKKIDPTAIAKQDPALDKFSLNKWYAQ